MEHITLKDFKKISDYVWEIPKNFRHDMKVPARIYITREMLEKILGERAVEQLINVATLPGIEEYALAMPDIHQGYGFPIGGVAAIRSEDGVISPGGVGYDINCGVRLLLSQHHTSELKDKIVLLANQIQRDIPSGVGRGSDLKLSQKELAEVLNTGVKWALQNGYAEKEDLEAIEEEGSYKEADASSVTERAKKRGQDQLGTLGAGNHFIEIQEVEQIYDEPVAQKFGIFQGQITIMIHTGSRGLGHQTCTDYVRIMDRAMAKYNIRLPDRELACAPFKSEEGQKYFRAMAASANFAWANRQMITYEARKAWNRILGNGGKLKILYDVAHNIAKLEKYNGREYIIHRKGATRAFGPSSAPQGGALEGKPVRSELPEKYRETGQPVIIPGSMGTASYVLVGTEIAMQETFGSTCHGAGRAMSRMKSKRVVNLSELKKRLEEKGIVVRAGSAKGLVEEAPESYKDIEEVISVVHGAGIALKVAKLKPLAVIKG
jgi:tRNA-splicing ligase RtcB